MPILARVKRELFEQGTWIGVLVMLLMLCAIGGACYWVGHVVGDRGGYERGCDEKNLLTEDGEWAPLDPHQWPEGGWG